MARGRLYEFAILHHPTPTKEQRDSGETPKSSIIQQPKTVVAEDEKQVAILAARALDDDYMAKLNEVEIVVRPFDRTRAVGLAGASQIAHTRQQASADWSIRNLSVSADDSGRTPSLVTNIAAPASFTWTAADLK